jgi:hypothetical protein
MAKPASSDCASRNASAASSYSKLWSKSAPRRNAGWAAGEPEVGKSDLSELIAVSRSGRDREQEREELSVHGDLRRGARGDA